jgi:hypothetical protein
MGLITLQIVDIKSGSAIPESIYIYVNSGQGPFTASEGDCGSYVWVRTSTNQRDFDKINSAVGNGFDSKWAFVATWINFEVGYILFKLLTHVCILDQPDENFIFNIFIY